MNKTVIKIIIVSAVLLVTIGVIILLAVVKINLGFVETASIKSISERNTSISKEGSKLAVLEKSYEDKDAELKAAETEYNQQIKRYEAISDETLQIIKEATMEKEYSLEYLWITLGNYAKAHKLSIAIIEPGGTVGGNTETTPKAGEDIGATVNTGTGVRADASGKVTNDNEKAAENKDTADGEDKVTVTEGLSASTDAATIQVKGDYINLADFVYEVENDKDLRFRLDNISMKSAGGSEVIASFKVKNLTLMKY